MTGFQRIFINTERWNEAVVTPSLAKPHEFICTPNTKTFFEIQQFKIHLKNGWYRSLFHL